MHACMYVCVYVYTFFLKTTAVPWGTSNTTSRGSDMCLRMLVSLEPDTPSAFPVAPRLTTARREVEKDGERRNKGSEEEQRK